MPRKSKLRAFLLLGFLTLVLGSVLLMGIMAPPSQAQQPAAMPDLAVQKYKVSGSFTPGELVKYEIYFINQGGYVASDVRIVDTLPTSTTYVTIRWSELIFGHCRYPWAGSGGRPLRGFTHITSER